MHTITPSTLQRLNTLNPPLYGVREMSPVDTQDMTATACGWKGKCNNNTPHVRLLEMETSSCPFFDDNGDNELYFESIQNGLHPSN